MYIFLTVLIILVCLFIMMVVLVQNPKGGGLGAGFGGAASNMMGVQRTGDLLEKLTWGSAIVLLVLSLSTSFFIDRNKSAVSTETTIDNFVDETFAPEVPSDITIPTTPPQ